MNRAAFLDRDGVLNQAIVRNGRPYAPRSLDEFVILVEAPGAVRRLAQAGFMIIVVTNQRDIGAGLMSAATLDEMHARLAHAMPIDDIRVCTCIDDCPCYKPNAGMLLDAARDWDIDLSASVMIGDRWRDIGAGKNAGCRTILIERGYTEGIAIDPDLTAADLSDAVDKLLACPSLPNGNNNDPIEA
jgi:D-glycero-D-manno-heptose 1,7-bisphosphate phosphatase